MERRRCDGPPNFWPTLRTNSINLRQNFICEITTQPSIFLFPHYITFHNFASLLSGSRIFLFPFSPFSRNFFPSCQTPTQTILRNLLVLVPPPRIAISPIRDLSLRLSFFFFENQAAWTGSGSWIYRRTWISITSLLVCWFFPSIFLLNRSPISTTVAPSCC